MPIEYIQAVPVVRVTFGDGSSENKTVADLGMFLAEADRSGFYQRSDTSFARVVCIEVLGENLHLLGELRPAFGNGLGQA